MKIGKSKRLIAMLLSATMVLGGMPKNIFAEISGSVVNPTKQITTDYVDNSTEKEAFNENEEVTDQTNQNNVEEVLENEEVTDQTSQNNVEEALENEVDENEISTFASNEQAISSVPFKATLYDYDNNKFNSASNYNGFLFGPSGSKYMNTYNGAKLTQGILKNELVNSGSDGYLPVVTGDVDTVGLFSKTTDTSKGRTVYDNVNFPFLYDSNTGYYTFDSSKNHTHLVTGENNTYETDMKLYNGAQSIGGKGQFFPFNSEGDRTPNYYFGMSLGVKFFMTEDGKIEVKNSDGTTTKEDIKFEFSGDDDVWVFIDGKLVLDLGGIHDTVQGEINFANQEVIYHQTRTNLDKSVNSSTKDSLETMYDGAISLESLADGEEHNLQIFYLERGANISNCKIKFNLPQKDVLEVNKVLAQGSPLTSNEFKFKVEYSQDGQNYVPYANQKYSLYNGTSAEPGEYSTNENGELTLTRSQSARFIDPTYGDFRITEIDTKGYTATWSAEKIYEDQKETIGSTSEVDENSHISPIIEIEKDDGTDKKLTTYSATCTNKGELGLNPDLVVLDFGKAVNIDVLANDGLEGYTGVELTSVVKNNDNNADLNGKIELTNNQKVKYTPTKFLESIDKAKYTVTYLIDDSGNKGTQESDITIMPATSVYYEDNFGDGENTVINYGAGWEVVGTNSVSEIKLDDPIGYDSAYDGNTTFSSGTVHKATATTSPIKADFEFTGTGIDIYGHTSKLTGKMSVQVYKKVNGTYSNKATYTAIVDTVYKSGDVYQTPIFSYDSKTTTPETYKVVITVPKNSTIYIDAFRMYNPIGNVNSAYGEESGTSYVDIRDQITSTTPLFDVKGNLFVDEYNGIQAHTIDLSNEAGKQEYITYGRKREVAVSPGESITIKFDDKPDFVQLGARTNALAPSHLQQSNLSNQVLVNGVDIKLSSATDMYYNVSINDNNELVIENNTNYIITLTNLKLK